METKEGGRKRLDFTVNVQSLAVSVVIGVATAVGIYFGVVSRVQALEIHDNDQNKRFERIESDMRDQRRDVKEQLSAIGSNVEKIRDYLLDNAAGQRPDIRKWAK
jgi:hypothetical protein